MKKLLIAAGALMAGTAVFAQTAPVAPPAAPAPMARPMADKVMTRAEVVAKVREHFARLDANRDGVGHHRRSQAGNAGPKGRCASPSGTAASRACAACRRPRRRVRPPRCQPGRSDQPRRIRQGPPGTRSNDARRDPGEAQGRRQGGDGRRPVDAHAPHGRLRRPDDRHGGHQPDGRITLAEAETMALQHFDQMDTNRDGQVTPEERRAARPMMIKRMQAPSAG